MKWLTECNPVDAAKLSRLLKAAREFTRWDWTHLIREDDERNDLCLLEDLSVLKEAVKAITVDAETPEGFCAFCEVETAGEAHSLVNCIESLREKRFAAEYDKHVAESELARLRKLFDDAGQGEHNVLALIDHYQSEVMALEEERRATLSLLDVASDRRRYVLDVLADSGCSCDCGHDSEGHTDDCERCLGCRIEEALR